MEERLAQLHAVLDDEMSSQKSIRRWAQNAEAVAEIGTDGMMAISRYAYLSRRWPR
ncbi:MAG TPA: hypothetical protein VFT59_00565 [Candidatus Saccharimonadales bacterium]|nr:hypothetical protein [Candidatus Saccharimonadales bacterium]